MPPQTLIEIVEHLPGDLDGKAVGCYIPATRRVMLLNYSAFAATGTWFRVPVDRELYQSAVAHEVAHAMVACNAASGRLPLAAESWRHYLRQPDHAAWLRDIVAGRVVEEWPSEGP